MVLSIQAGIIRADQILSVWDGPPLLDEAINKGRDANRSGNRR